VRASTSSPHSCASASSAPRARGRRRIDRDARPHQDRLRAAASHLDAAASAARRAVSPDLIASDARRGLDALGEIVGAVSTEELLGRIFERFCVGK